MAGGALRDIVLGRAELSRAAFRHQAGIVEVAVRHQRIAGRRDALNPAELLLVALSACMIKGIERVVPMLKFSLRGVEIRVHGVRQDVPPRMERIDYEIVVDTDEPDRRLELLHDNVKKYGTVFNTVAPGTDLRGVLVRAT